MVSLEEYLNTSYDPDLEYVDGVLFERNVGDLPHSRTQRNLIVAFRRYPAIYALPSLRTKTRETRYRLIDICVLLALPQTSFLLEPAFVAIEILSDEDSMSRMMEKLEEYAQQGVPNIWLVDPRLQTIFAYSSGMLSEVRGETIATIDPRLELTRDEVFRR